MNILCILTTSSEVMIKWVKRYEVAKMTRFEERRDFRKPHICLPYPENLELLPKDYDIQGLREAMYQAKSNGEMITDEEWEYARGCNPAYVNASLSTLEMEEDATLHHFPP